MEEKQLNGDSEILLREMKAEIRGVKDLSKAESKFHNERAEVVRDRAENIERLLLEHINCRSKNGPAFSIIISVIVGVLTLCYAGIWSLGSFMQQQMTMNQEGMKAELEKVNDEILRIRKWKDETEAKVPEIEGDLRRIDKQIGMLHSINKSMD